MSNIVIILGKSGSGKSTLYKHLVREMGFYGIKTMTTRKKRDEFTSTESDIIDTIINRHLNNNVSDEYIYSCKFEPDINRYAETAKYTLANGTDVYYFTEIFNWESACNKENNCVIVMDPTRLQNLIGRDQSMITNFNLNLVILDISDVDRIRRITNRGDDPNEIKRRASDEKLVWEDFDKWLYSSEFKEENRIFYRSSYVNPESPYDAGLRAAVAASLF